MEELVSAENCICKEMFDMPIVWIEMRDFLDSRGANLGKHLLLLLIMTLAHGLYTKGEHREAAIEMEWWFIVPRERRVRQVLTYSEEQNMHVRAQHEQVNFCKSRSYECGAHNVAMRLKVNGMKFSGDLEQ